MAIEAYLTQFPEGVFAALARVKLEELTGQQGALLDQLGEQSAAFSADATVEGDEGRADINGIWKGNIFFYKHEGASNWSYKCGIEINVVGYKFDRRNFTCGHGETFSISGSVDGDGRIQEGSISAMPGSAYKIHGNFWEAKGKQSFSSWIVVLDLNKE